MSPGASLCELASDTRRDRDGRWAAAIAILFAVVALTSFAVDQSLTLSSLPAPPPPTAHGR